MALKRCVIILHPAFTADFASSYVASECPIETRIPWEVRDGMLDSAPGSSGARVIREMGEGDVRFEAP